MINYYEVILYFIKFPPNFRLTLALALIYSVVANFQKILPIQDSLSKVIFISKFPYSTHLDNATCWIRTMITKVSPHPENPRLTWQHSVLVNTLPLHFVCLILFEYINDILKEILLPFDTE